MISLYKGAKGRGKTLSMIKDAYLYKLDGWDVLSNMKGVTFAKFISNEDILKINKNSPLYKVVLLIDEIQTLFNSRRSMKKENVDFSFFLQQIRKRGIILLCTSQFSNTTDLTLRQNLDIMVTPKFDKVLLVCHVKYVDLNSIEEDIFNDDVKPVVVEVVFDAQSIFGLYDTDEIIA